MAKKTSRPEMTWLEAKKLWRKRITLNGEKKDVYGKTQEEVRKKVEELKSKIKEGLVINDKTTVSALSREWFLIKKSTVRASSAGMYESCLASHILPFFGEMPIAEVKPMHIQKCLSERSHLSYSQQSKILITISQIMKMAVDNRLVKRNPCDGIKAGGQRPKEVIPLTDEQQKTLLKGIKGEKIELFVMLCLYAGLRREEALGLLWSNVVLDDVPYIRVRHSVVYDGNNPVHSDNLKTKAAKRDIPIPKMLAEALRNARGKTDTFFVIPAPRNKGALPETTYERWWKTAANVIPGVHAHQLRHTYLTTLCASGMDIKKIQYLAGHEDVKMTLRIYTHVKSAKPKDIFPDIQKAFGGKLGGIKIKIVGEGLEK